MNDIAGLGKAAEKLIEVVSNGIGTLYRPRAIRNEAAAEADAIRLLSSAKSDAEVSHLARITEVEIARALCLEELDTKLVERAGVRIAVQEIRRQKNLESIADAAAAQLSADVSDRSVDEDWIARFFKAAENISSKDMQLLWGKLLACEVEAPGSFSARTVDILRDLTRREAEVFQRLYSLSFDTGYLIQAPPWRDHMFSHDWLEKFGITFDDLLSLQAAGLIHNAESAVPYIAVHSAEPDRLTIAILICGKVVRFKACEPKDKVWFPVVRFTQAGIELLRVVPRLPIPDGFLEHVADCYGLELVSESGSDGGME